MKIFKKIIAAVAAAAIAITALPMSAFGAEDWMAKAKVIQPDNRVKESTLANYMSKFEKHILPEFGDIPHADLTTGRINAFINQKLADGLSASYVRDSLISFNPA